MKDFVEQQRKLSVTAESISIPKKRRVLDDDLFVEDTSEVRSQFQRMEM
jgi:hypothetical protein